MAHRFRLCAARKSAERRMGGPRPRRFVKGHGFTHAAKAENSIQALPVPTLPTDRPETGDTSRLEAVKKSTFPSKLGQGTLGSKKWTRCSRPVCPSLRVDCPAKDLVPCGA